MSEKRLRTEQVNVRLTLDELMVLSEKALNAGFTTIPAYLRWAGLKR